MRNKVGMFVSFLFLCAMTLVGVGCSDGRWCDNAPVCCEQPCAQPYQPVCSQPCEPVCAPRQAPCAPVCPPACPPAPCKPVCQPVEPVCAPVCRPVDPCGPEPLCKPLVRCAHPSSNELRCLDSITVTARNPRMCILGDQYPLDFDVKACDDVCDVVVTTHLPEGVSYIRSEPEAKVDGRKLTWNIGPMSKGECRPARVWLKCECEGELCACFCATATPVRFCALLCAKPILTCEKCGPEQVCPGDPVNYTISVTNRGSCTAEEVVIVDNLPAEVEHASCLRTLTFKLGCLEPCQTKTVNICTTAVKRGKICNTAVVSACNADSTSCQWCTCICCCGVDIEKTGPKEVAIGKNADYQIVVTNTGDLVLTDVVVTDHAPTSTSIVAANGATINGNQAVWKLRELKPGEKVSFNVTLTTCVTGCFTNRVSVTNCQDCNACAEFTTRWKGRPALNLCIAEGENPICIGERTTYTITVVNQGQESDNNVNVVVHFPAELAPVSVSGDSEGTISGQTVTFAPYTNLRPKQTLTYRVEAEAKSSGDARPTVDVTSDSTKTALTQQASTIIN
jgi:uncharacterized repeat protein (TIGR01451 family)